MLLFDVDLEFSHFIDIVNAVRIINLDFRTFNFGINFILLVLDKGDVIVWNHESHFLN